MTKPSPLSYGCSYHVYARGTNRENIFVEPPNYEHFLRLYGHHVAPIADTYAYCLLKNHFHLLIRIKTTAEIGEQTRRVSETLRVHPAPSQTFSTFLNAYAKSINLKYNRTGSLFQHPFGRILVEHEQYFARLVVYIHRNPQRHGLIENFRDWPHSSFQTLLSNKATRLCRHDALAWFGNREWFIKSHMDAEVASETLPLIQDDFD